MKKCLGLFFILIISWMPISYADESDMQNSPENDIAQLSEYENFLKSEITKIDTELYECKRKQKNWRAATIVGGVGIAATGTAAIIQGVKIAKKKKAGETVQEQPDDKQGQTDAEKD